ncbi:MAG: enoyl-CoA hydratase [Betaproteobacteria bacterium]|nr:enoyl-CoA hydratase [Betaproteobacteria bacterium]
MNDTVSPEIPLLLDTTGGIAVVTLNRPRAFNALSSSLLEALHQAMDQLCADPAVRVIVIAGSGKAFCAGHDLKEMQAAHDAAFVQRLFAQCSELMLKIARAPVPVIAEVNGMATAAGCQLVAQADLAVAADHATFAVSGVNLGLFCSTPAVPLSRVLARKRAAEMLMTGEFIDAQQAVDWGLVNRVAAASDLRATTLKLCATLIAKPRATLALGKALFNRQLEMGLNAAYQDASAAIACNFLQPEAQEGVQAFLEKRPARWPGHEPPA